MRCLGVIWSEERPFILITLSADLATSKNKFAFMAFARAFDRTQRRRRIALNEMNFSSSLVKFSDNNFHFSSAARFSLTKFNLFTTKFSIPKSDKSARREWNLNGIREQHFRDPSEEFSLERVESIPRRKSEKGEADPKHRLSVKYRPELLTRSQRDSANENIISNVTLSWWSELKLRRNGRSCLNSQT